MPGIKLQKRAHDFFVSYGHADRDRIAPLVDILTHDCKLGVWFDGRDGNAAVRNAELLGGAIRNARGALFCLSQNWKGSEWCRGEYEVSLSERRMVDGFEIVSLRLDDVEQPEWFDVAEILDFRQSTAAAMAGLLRSLASDVPHRFDNAQDVYLCAPWSKRSELVTETFGVLRKAGWRLVGDAPNRADLGEHRIEAIQRTTRGVVAILPHDPAQPSGTSPYILQEAQLAVMIGKPLLLLAESGIVPPEDIARAAFRGSAFKLAPGQPGRDALAAVCDDFDERLDHEPHDDTGAFIFLAASLRGDRADMADVLTVVERASNMRCIQGERLEPSAAGQTVQQAIIDRIRHAAVVIADVSDDHRNTLIETGVAMGHGTPVKLICRAPENGVLPKKRFMFEGQELFWYRTPEQRLALCYSLARQFRRRVYVIRA